MIIAVVEDRTLSILTGTFAATIAAKDIEHIGTFPFSG